MPIDSRSMATRLQISGPVEIADLEMYRRKLPLTPEARVNGTFQIELGRKFSPKGLLPGKYLFFGELEENSWGDLEKNSSRKFWRCATFGVHENGNEQILDYEVLNISTLLAYESVQIVNDVSHCPIGYKTDEEKYKDLKVIKGNIVEVVEQIKSKRYDDYYPVKWRFINRKDMIDHKKITVKTLTVKKLEEIENIDTVDIFKKMI